MSDQLSIAISITSDVETEHGKRLRWVIDDVENETGLPVSYRLNAPENSVTADYHSDREYAAERFYRYLGIEPVRIDPRSGERDKTAKPPTPVTPRPYVVDVWRKQRFTVDVVAHNRFEAKAMVESMRGFAPSHDITDEAWEATAREVGIPLGDLQQAERFWGYIADDTGEEADEVGDAVRRYPEEEDA